MVDDDSRRARLQRGLSEWLHWEMKECSFLLAEAVLRRWWKRARYFARRLQLLREYFDVALGIDGD